tara:strand:- start:28 stop:642 length:615 start_codon:yes stop_codon:yes gene_type:complete
MKKIIMLAAFIAAAASLSAGKFDTERPDWAPIEPDIGLGPTQQVSPVTQLERDLLVWALKHQVVSQYDPLGLDRTYLVRGDRRVTALTAAAPNTLSESEQEEVEGLNRQVDIALLSHEKNTLEHPRRAVVEEPEVDVKQAQLDSIDELKNAIASLKETIADRERVVSTDDTSLSTPVVAAMAGLGGLSLASLIGLAFTRRGVVS